jgi:hypothetical protein
VPKGRAEILARVSFHLFAVALLGKARNNDEALTDLSWKALATEVGTAAIAYLEANVGPGTK